MTTPVTLMVPPCSVAMAPSHVQSCSASANAVVSPERTCCASPCKVEAGVASRCSDGTHTRTRNVYIGASLS